MMGRRLLFLSLRDTTLPFFMQKKHFRIRSAFFMSFRQVGFFTNVNSKKIGEHGTAHCL